MVERHKYFLLFLSEGENRQIKYLLQWCTKTQLIALREVVLNIIKGHIPLASKHKAELKKHKAFLIALVNNKISRCKIAKKSKLIKVLMTIARDSVLEHF